MSQEQTCPFRGGCPSPTSTPEELERRAVIQRNDLLLHEAVIKNDTESVRRILKEPIDVNSRNNYGRAPVHWASARGNIDIMEMLVAANCDVEARDKYGMRPLHMAAWHGHPKAVRMLINLGASTNATTKSQCTLLMCAARNDRLDVVDLVLDTLEDARLDAADGDGRTALLLAATHGHAGVARRLLAAGAAADRRDKAGRTALHAACEGGHDAVAGLLLASGAAAEARDAAGEAPLHVAAAHQQTALVRLLLEAGADPDSENEKGCTPLHIACSLGSKGIIELLLQHGASLGNQNMSGNTPLHMACQANLTDTVEILINKGADLNCLNKRLQSPIHIAAELGHGEVCRLLLAAGADIDQREQGGRTPLYIAARGSFTAIVDMIIKTARLDYPAPEDRRDSQTGAPKASRRWRSASRDGATGAVRCAPKDSERLREILYKVAYKHLGPGEWKTLAAHWAFTDDQVKAIEHQYNGPSSYKEHGFRMMLIWAHGLAIDANPVKELYDSLVAVGKRQLADSLRRKIDAENEARRKGGGRGCHRCSVS